MLKTSFYFKKYLFIYMGLICKCLQMSMKNSISHKITWNKIYFKCFNKYKLEIKTLQQLKTIFFKISITKNVFFESWYSDIKYESLYSVHPSFNSFTRSSRTTNIWYFFTWFQFLCKSPIHSTLKIIIITIIMITSWHGQKICVLSLFIILQNQCKLKTLNTWLKG